MNTYSASPGFKTSGTSQDAAESMQSRVVLLRRRVIALLSRWRKGLTADECAREMGESVLSIRPRFSELRHSGVIEDSGQRRQNISGRSATVWQLVRK